jgi:hypothetical protein
MKWAKINTRPVTRLLPERGSDPLAAPLLSALSEPLKYSPRYIAPACV